MGKIAYIALFISFALFFSGCTLPAQNKALDSIFFNDSVAVPINNSQSSPVIVFTCPDGTLVTDAQECKNMGINSSFACPDGRLVGSISDCETCKDICDDSDSCTLDICSSQTSFECVHVKKTSPECTAKSSGCAGGDMIEGKCVCSKPTDLEVNGVCTLSLCMIDWGGGRIEKLKTGICSDSYYEESNERPYCNSNVEISTDCAICGCKGGVACIGGKCANTSDLSMPDDATPVYQYAENNGIKIIPKVVSNNGTVSLLITTKNGVPLEALVVPTGSTISKRISTIGYVNFTIARSNFNLDTRYQWAVFQFNAYSIPCIEINQKKAIAIQTPLNPGMVEYIAVKSDSSAIYLKEKPISRAFSISADTSEIELTGVKGVFMSYCNSTNTTAFVTLSSTRPFDYRQVNY